MSDVYNLQRFVDAQRPVYDRVLLELAAGRKQSHWMWYIFPQIHGLGGSAMSRKYAISTPDEARAYADHPLLGPRLRECTQHVLDVEGRTADQIFGYPDVMKFRSCMTLFSQACPEGRLFERAIEKYYSGAADQATLDILKTPSAHPLS